MEVCKEIRRHKPYTEEEDDYILENYKKLGRKVIAKKLHRTPAGIRNRHMTLRRKNGGYRPAELNTNAEQRIMQFIAAITIIRKIKHEDKVSVTMEAVRAGWLDDVKIKVV